MHVTHVIFDFDGLLVDTESCYTVANQTMLRKFGREYTPELNAKIMGQKVDVAIPLLLKEVGIDGKITPTEYMAEYDALLSKMFRNCKAMPGAEKLVRHLHKKEIPMAICSGSRAKTFAERREPHKDWLDLISLKSLKEYGDENKWMAVVAFDENDEFDLSYYVVFAGDEPQIKRGKPFPDSFLATMMRFACKPKDTSNVLVFEDSPNGGRAAVAAGMQCVMVPAENHRQEALNIGVSQVLHSLTEFRPEEFGLPPFD